VFKIPWLGVLRALLSAIYPLPRAALIALEVGKGRPVGAALIEVVDICW
jgi:hypothetical protein